MTLEPYKLTLTQPAADEYVRLRTIAGLTPMSHEAARIGLPRSIIAVCVRQGDTLVGMGRVIGDGGLFFQVVDIAVHPDHQRKGVGTLVMQALIEQLKSTAPSGAYVSLIADDGAEYLYQRFGFKPTAPRSIAMAQILP